MKGLLLAFIFALLIFSSVGFVSAIVPKQDAIVEDGGASCQKQYDSISVTTFIQLYGVVKFQSARADFPKALIFAYKNVSEDTAKILLAHQAVPSNNKGIIHTLEGENARENDWIIVNQGVAGSILEVTDLTINSGEGRASFQDAITGEQQIITLINGTGTNGYYQRSGVNFYGGTGYNIRMITGVLGGDVGAKVSITWGPGSSPGNPGTDIVVAPEIKLQNGAAVILTTSQYAQSVLKVACSSDPNAPVVVGVSRSTGAKICLPMQLGGDFPFYLNIGDPKLLPQGSFYCKQVDPTIPEFQCIDSYGNILKTIVDLDYGVQYSTMYLVSYVNCTNATVISPKTYRACSVNNTCVQVTGLGKNSCSIDNDCLNQTGPRHLECKYKGNIGWCAYAPGFGNNTCAISENCNDYSSHGECILDSCISLPGNKTSTCSSDSDCSHKECTSIFGDDIPLEGCMRIIGAGPDKCSLLGSACIHESPPVKEGWFSRFLRFLHLKK